LTVTFGFSSSFFDGQCAPASARPAGLIDLPAFAGDALEAAWNGGDVLVQVCADDPTVVSHAIRQLRRVGLGIVALRWMQNGFLSHAPVATPRHLFGQVDGTANPTAGSSKLSELVWVRKDDGPAWMAGGTHLGLRRIRKSMTMWDRMGLSVQEPAVGRSRTTGEVAAAVARDAQSLVCRDGLVVGLGPARGAPGLMPTMRVPTASADAMTIVPYPYR
jgi:deferrochelatase/peroxidase EfeB